MSPRIVEVRKDILKKNDVLARALRVSDTAIESRLSAQYAPVLGHLVKARRALRDAFDTHPPRPPRR